jgi:uncharacterized protein YndB with AHSA1/START domain
MKKGSQNMFTDSTERRQNNDSAVQINWPEKFRPEKCDTHVRNDIDINAPSEVVWEWLINATRWPEWYPNSSNVRILNKDNNVLTAGAKFAWTTFGDNIMSEILEYVPNERIAWGATSEGIEVYHAWLIKKTDAGSYVLTEETQKGPKAVLLKKTYPTAMYDGHQLWLERLKEKSEETAKTRT